MIEFLNRNEVPTAERIRGRYVFAALPISEHRSEFVAVASYVTAANSLFLTGHPVKMSRGEDGSFNRATVVEREKHRLEMVGVRVICDTIEEALALANTRQPIKKIIAENAGYLDPAEIKKRIDAVYNALSVRFNGPKPPEERRMTNGEALMARVSARLERLPPEPTVVPMHLDRVPRQPTVAFGRRM
ncbi:hypothetical protein GOB57_09825 [Sinorhizobium meliloti]|nr:hypothetical protein [Sinorhizobium meliloti]